MANAPQKTARYKAIGLYTFPNQYSAPSGAMAACQDIFIDRPGVIEAARAWYAPATAPSIGANIGIDAIQQLYPGTSSASMIGQGVSYNSGTQKYGYGNLYQLKMTGSPSTTSWGNPNGRLTSSFYANSNTYFAVGGGVGEYQTGTYVPAGPSYPALLRSEAAGSFISRGCGMPEAPAPIMYTGTSGSGLSSLTAPTASLTWGPSADLTQQRAYRVLFSYKDSNGNLVRGAPSGRLIVYDPAADFGLIVIGTDRLLAGDIVQIYASELQPTSASTPPQAIASEPTDDMRLVFEHIVVAADIANGYFTAQDISPDALRGTSLYTNATQDGILGAEQPPPPASLTDYFNNVVFYAGVSWPGFSYLNINLIGLNGWSSGGSPSSITFGTTYTAATSEDLVNHKFKLFTAGTPSQNLQNTARSICNVMNFKASGQLFIYATPPNATSVTILFKFFGQLNTPTDGGTIWQSGITTANIPASTISPASLAGSSVLSSFVPNAFSRLYFSKPGQPEAVPETNYIIVGSPSCAIVGICHLRDSLFVFKTDGLYRVTGTSKYDIVSSIFDETVKMFPGGFRTIARAGNQIFAFTNQGVVSVTETGVSIISGQIEDILYPYIGSQINSSQVSNSDYVGFFYCSGAASDSERKYYLLLLSQTGTTTFNYKYMVYNFITHSWTQVSSSMQGPASQEIPLCLFRFSPAVGPEQIIESGVDQAGAKYFYGMARVGNIDSIANAYKNGATWTYTFAEEESAGMAKLYYDVKIVTQGSASSSGVSVTFSSDSGAAPVMVTPTVYNQYILNAEVPKEHQYCSSLQLQITGPTSGNNKFLVSEVQTNYDIVSEWSVK